MSLGLDACEVRLCPPCVRVCACVRNHTQTHIHIHTSTSHTKAGRRGSLRLPRCVSTGPVVVRLAGKANERERERERGGGAV